MVEHIERWKSEPGEVRQGPAAAVLNEQQQQQQYRQIPRGAAEQF